MRRAVQSRLTPQEQLKLYAKCAGGEGKKQPDAVFSRQAHGRDVAGGPSEPGMSMYNFLRRGLKERLNSTAISRTKAVGTNPVALTTGTVPLV